MTHFRGWLRAGSLALVVATAVPVFGQGRAAQTPAPSTPATTPGGRGGRGGVPGPEPAVGGEVDEALATPYFAIQHTFNHMGLNPEMHKNVIWNYYQAGHMLYIDNDSAVKLKHDIGEFIAGSLPKEGLQ